MNNHKPIVYKDQRVLITNQLAVSFETESIKIQQNFNNNKTHYKEGKHFFLIQGEELRELKGNLENFEVASNINRLYLWTERGAWLHAKSLNTDKAWEAYETLVDDYYRIRELAGIHSFMIEDPISRAHKWIEEETERKELETKKILLEQKIAEHAPKIAYYDVILNSKGTVTTSQIAKDYGLTAPQLNKILKEAGIQYKQNGQWLLYRKHADKGYTQSHSFDFKHRDGTPETRMNTKWTQRGRIFIHKFLTELGIKPNIEKDYSDAN